MIKHKNQRVGVFIDVQNLYYSAKALYGRKVSFGEVLKTAVADRQLIRALAYVVRATGEEQPFFDALYERGLETKERELQEFHGGAKKADWDVGITVDAIRIGEILDVVVIVSGDGDFVELVEYLKHHGRQVEVIAFRQSASSKLIEAADDFVDLSENKDKYTIKGSMRRPAGRKKDVVTDDAKRDLQGEKLDAKKPPVNKAAAPSDKKGDSESDSFWIKPPEKKTRTRKSPPKKRGGGKKS
ncbi:NYN domain-containing protein [Patescibacteria group bacterium]